MSNTCDNCKNPGCCCKAFLLKNSELSAFSAIESKGETLQRLKLAKLPFKPIRKGKQFWVFTCTKIKKGKCEIYNNRPKLCKTYRPGTGNLCCMSKKYNKNPTTGD